ncbi:MAG: cell division protein WhiA [Pseudonocardiales bacterium]|jgi:DNA-binding protein WhiA|nr:cell division protein WhiA [Pseudonocardiales bacterium]
MAALTPVTRAVAEELCWVSVDPAACPAAKAATELRCTETATVLRLAGRFTGTATRLVLVAELDHAVVGVRLRDQLALIAGRSCAIGLTGSGHGERRMIISSGVAALTQRLGLLDQRGRLVRGLPTPAEGYIDRAVAAAVWRGAFLARGRLSDPGDEPRVTVVCPGPETARVLAGAAGWLRVPARWQPASRAGAELVVVEGEDEVAALLVALGAPTTSAIWHRQRRARSGATASGAGVRGRG